MAVDAGLIARIEEALAPLGTVTRRAMMGGATLYLDGTIFAIVADDQLWFKADAESDPAWESAGCPRFTYPMGEGRRGSMNYRRAPDDVYDDADAMRDWAALGLAAEQRAPVRRPRKAASKK
ncbi:MAG: competence protein TfoX [Sphingomonas sp. 28-66-16]|nr:MAG: competence protein TfoX [Sphingomonas sp. 28-66-16]